MTFKVVFRHQDAHMYVSKNVISIFYYLKNTFCIILFKYV